MDSAKVIKYCPMWRMRLHLADETDLDLMLLKMRVLLFDEVAFQASSNAKCGK
jgi:hypothetical protein